jgi:sodium/bile acid cotransporter 7
MEITKIKAAFQKHWFLLALVFAIILAYLFPQVGKKGGDLKAEYLMPYVVVVLIFLIAGLSIKTRDFLTASQHWQLIILVQVFNLGFIPLFGYGVANLLIYLNFNQVLSNGLILALCAPTTISSNVVMTKTAGGNEPVALVNAIIGSALGVFITPFLVELYVPSSYFSSTQTSLYGTVFLNMFLTVILPLIVGQIIRHFFLDLISRVNSKTYGTIGSCLLLILVWSVFCDTFSSNYIQQISLPDIIVVMIIDFLLFSLFSVACYYISRLPVLNFTPLVQYNLQRIQSQ